MPRKPTGSSSRSTCSPRRSRTNRCAAGTASAYQKRAPQVIDWLAEIAAARGRRIMVRLVKGAYWDSEIKRAQERGLPDYPVFTRKAMTDLCYAVCTRKLLAVRARLYPQFATHNALTVASVI
jgi:RHH-type proline utilization regulon transcriptional repressor/proline dehydrogenase/delta 1-pyrroline-5-carboxylate dehydrogenase